MKEENGRELRERQFSILCEKVHKKFSGDELKSSSFYWLAVDRSYKLKCKSTLRERAKVDWRKGRKEGWIASCDLQTQETFSRDAKEKEEEEEEENKREREREKKHRNRGVKICSKLRSKYGSTTCCC